MHIKAAIIGTILSASVAIVLLLTTTGFVKVTPGPIFGSSEEETPTDVTWNPPVDERYDNPYYDMICFTDATSFEINLKDKNWQNIKLESISFKMGSRDIGWLEHEVALEPFCIDRDEVTNEEFAAFLNAKGNKTEEKASWYNIDTEDSQILLNGITNKFEVSPGFEYYPVANVSWYGAKAYSEWAGKRLPSEGEWEYAAAGPERYKFPLGDKYESADYVYNMLSTQEVGTRRSLTDNKAMPEIIVFTPVNMLNTQKDDVWISHIQREVRSDLLKSKKYSIVPQENIEKLAKEKKLVYTNMKNSLSAIEFASYTTANLLILSNYLLENEVMNLCIRAVNVKSQTDIAEICRTANKYTDKTTFVKETAIAFSTKLQSLEKVSPEELVAPKANGWGLYDMAGNVYEWLSSRYESYPYNPKDGREDLAPFYGNRCIRGGSYINYYDSSIVLRSQFRNYQTAHYSNNDLGFRCAKTYDPKVFEVKKK